MLNSVFIFLNSYNKNKIWSVLAGVSWIIYMLINQNNFDSWFSIINILAFIITAFSIRIIKNKTINGILSVSSILIWSTLIDVATYIIYPDFTMGLSVGKYILNGWAFNAKYIFSNVLILLTIEGVILLLNKLKKIIIKLDETNKKGKEELV